MIFVKIFGINQKKGNFIIYYCILLYIIVVRVILSLVSLGHWVSLTKTAKYKLAVLLGGCVVVMG